MFAALSMCKSEMAKMRSMPSRFVNVDSDSGSVSEGWSLEEEDGYFCWLRGRHQHLLFLPADWMFVDGMLMPLLLMKR